MGHRKGERVFQVSDTIDIINIAAWSEPKRLNTKQGPKILRVAACTDKFRKIWKADKESCRAAGLGWEKDYKTGDLTGRITWWAPDTQEAVRQNDAIAVSRASAPVVSRHLPIPAGLAYLGYQEVGISFCLDREAALIADEMGLGKTIQAIGVINADVSLKRILIICPASLKLNWKRELSTWLTRGDLTVGIADGKTCPPADVVIINYDVLTKHLGFLHAGEWDLVIVDESHYLKNPKAQRTVAALGKWHKEPSRVKPAIRARKKIALTGTPILNRPIEIQPVLGWLSPKEFGHFWGFAKRYCAAYEGQWGWDLSGASNLEELQHKLRTSILIRRLKKDVLNDLPAKVRQVIELPANGCSALLAEEAEVQSKSAALIADLSDAVQLAKLCEDDTAYEEALAALRKANGVAFEDIARVRHDIALAKVPYVIEHVLNATGPVIVFAHHRDVVEAIRSGLTGAGKRCVTLIGGQSDTSKDAAVTAFQSGEADVFIGNFRAAGVGITLTASSHVIFAELDWVPAILSQAEDRAHRIGQTDSVLVQHIVLEGSLDQRLARAIVEKQRVADKALDKQLAAIEIKEPVTALNDVPEDEKVAREGAEFSAEQIQTFIAKLRRLSAVCDGAVQEDFQGFNAFDSPFGKSLAAQTSLSQKQAKAAALLCRKYRRQLGE